MALSQDADAVCQGFLPAAKHKQQTRPALLVARTREIAAGYLLEQDVARAQKLRYWASEWAMREHPDMCRTTADRELFLKNVRRWAKKAMHGAYGPVAGIVRHGDSASRARLGANQAREAAIRRLHRPRGGGFGAGAAQGS